MLNEKIKLQSSHGEIFDVDVKVAQYSMTIKQMLEDLGMDEKDEIIPISNVSATILKKVIIFAEHHKDDTSVVAAVGVAKERRRTDDELSSWDMEFLKVDKCTLFELILAAHYLDMKKLLNITSKAAANLIKGKTADEIRKIFDIRNDLSPAEEEHIRRENELLEEI